MYVQISILEYILNTERRGSLDTLMLNVWTKAQSVSFTLPDCSIEKNPYASTQLQRAGKLKTRYLAENTVEGLDVRDVPSNSLYVGGTYYVRIY